MDSKSIVKHLEHGDEGGSKRGPNDTKSKSPPGAPSKIGFDILEVNNPGDAIESSEMADPFVVRMRFSAQLQHLNASVTSAQKAGQFALKYPDMSEDLHSCILEQLERNNLNTRANIMYFIEHFLEMAQAQGQSDYVRMMQRDILRVVDAVAPEDGSGAANVKVVRKVLRALNQKSFLTEGALQEIEECLRERDSTVELDDTADMDLAGYSPPSQTIPSAVQRGASHSTSGGGGAGRDQPIQRRPDKRQIEQRIEEDRERHKRLRESIWAVPPSGDDAEKWRLWEETSDLGDDDHILGEEEFQERRRAMAMSCPHVIAEAEAREQEKEEAAAAAAAPVKAPASSQANGNGRTDGHN